MSDFTVESSTSDKPSDHVASNKICLDNVSERSINDAQRAMTSHEIAAMPGPDDKFPTFKHEHNYSDFLAAELDKVLRRQRPNWTWTATGTLSNQAVGRFSAQLGSKACTLRVVREARFGEKFCENFVRYTSEIGDPDIAVEAFEPLAGGQLGEWNSTQSNAVLTIEVKKALTLSDTDRKDAFQQLVCYLVTKTRPLTQEQNGERWLLRGLLLARGEGFLVTLRSNRWLDYPWECDSITHFVFNESVTGVRELLRRYVEVTLGGVVNADQLFKRPIELAFPEYPAPCERLAKNGNVVACKWQLVETLALKWQEEGVMCGFSKLPLSGDMDVVLKVVSPTIYPHTDDPGEIGQILAVLCQLLLSLQTIPYKVTVSDEAKQRLLSIDQLYQHIGSRGACKSSRLVVTAFRGQPICAINQLGGVWSNLTLRKRFLNEVCRTALDVVSVVGYAHTDIRPANIVFSGSHFTIIDWENTRTIGASQTAVSSKAKTKKSGAAAGAATAEQLDERYPDVRADNDVVRWLVFSACQLYMCIYIVDKTARGGNANAVEAEFRRGGGFWEASRLVWPVAVNDFPTWRTERRFSDLREFLEAGDTANVAVCRSVLEGILQCALEIEQL